MPQAIILDFDGVIAETEPLHFDAFVQVLSARGVTLSWKDYFERYVGLNDGEIRRRMIADYKLDSTDGESLRVQNEKDRAYRRRIEKGVEFLPGVEDFVRRARTTRVLAICSGSKRAEIETILCQADLLDAFEVLIAAEDVPVSKPDPGPYLATLRELSVSRPMLTAGDCLVVEDSAAGVRSANHAGMRVVSVRKSYGPELSQHTDATIDNLAELTEALLQKIGQSPRRDAAGADAGIASADRERE